MCVCHLCRHLTGYQNICATGGHNKIGEPKRRGHSYYKRQGILSGEVCFDLTYSVVGDIEDEPVGFSVGSKANVLWVLNI